MLRSIPPRTSTSTPSADPVRFRTRRKERQGERGEYDDLPPIRGKQFEKPQRRRPLACATCGGHNINGAEEHDGEWQVVCVACDSLQPAREAL